MKNEHRESNYGPIPAKYLGIYIGMYRKQKGWTQETLAEISRLHVRTIQRIEKGEGASTDARRALAEAFELDDIDVFNKPIQIPDEKQLIEENERIKKETITLALKKITDVVKQMYTPS